MAPARLSHSREAFLRAAKRRRRTRETAARISRLFRVRWGLVDGPASGTENAFLGFSMSRGAEERALTREEIDGLHRLLLEQRRTLFKEVEEVETDLRTINENREHELEEQGQAEAARRVLFSMGEQERQELEEIQSALTKIASGRYGTCESCGRAIGLARLQARPAATLCVGCQRAREGPYR